jgi:hypothetical protein
MSSDHNTRAPLSKADEEMGRRVWLLAAPRMTRLAALVIRLRVAREWSSERICRRLHISRRKYRRSLLIAIRQIDRASLELQEKKG